MTQPIILKSSQIRQWGERQQPVVKREAYVFSIDFQFTLDLDRIRRARDRVNLSLQNTVSGTAGSTYHVQDEVLVKTADDVVRDVPSGLVERANAWLSVGSGGNGTITGRTLLLVDTDTSVQSEYSGVVSMDGPGFHALSGQATNREVFEGSAFISFRSQCERPRYRWLVENQLFGFGHVSVTYDPASTPTNLIAEVVFSYDLYSMGGG
jgi:hypothetical protein